MIYCGVHLRKSGCNFSWFAFICRDMKLAATMAGVDTRKVPRIGSVIRVPVKEMRPCGLVCDVPSDSNLVGLIGSGHLPDNDLNPGDKADAAVLDVHELDGIIDLSASDVRNPSGFTPCMHLYVKHTLE